MTGMQQIYKAMELFAYNNCPLATSFNNKSSGSTGANGSPGGGPPQPTYHELGKIPETLDEIKEMSGAQRRALLSRAGVTGMNSTMVYLRAMQHVCTTITRGNVDYSKPCSVNSRHWDRNPYKMYINKNSTSAITAAPALHPFRSTHYWSPVIPYNSLIGEPIIVASKPQSDASGPLVSSTSAADNIPVAKKGHKSSLQYAGIQNQGSTCYLNSLLQCLFHLGSFCRAIYSIPTEDEKDGTKSMPLALQRLFYAMDTQEGSTQSTKELTQSFGWTHTEAFIQHDIHELTRKLIDNLEEKINAAALGQESSLSSIRSENRNSSIRTDVAPRSPTMTTSFGQEELKRNNAMRKLFVGQLENYIEVDDIQYKSATTQDFYDLQLVVKGKKNIYESLDTIIEPTLLMGKDKYLLEKPDGTKSYHDAKMGTRFRSFPPVLLMHLTRFEYDMEKDDIAKVLTRYEYYDTLDLHRFTPDVKREKCIYKLHAVLVHSGSNVEYGHYFCFVKRSRLRKVKSSANDCNNKSTELRDEEEWIKFNDSEVSRASRSDVFGANFGGFTLDHWGARISKTTSAYMLCYVQTYPTKDDFEGQFSYLLPAISDGRNGLHSSSSPLNCLVAPLAECEIPQHLKNRFEADKEERLRKIQEEREEHLYTRVHFITHRDMEDHAELFSMKFPRNLKFPSLRTLRALNTTRALDAFGPFVEEVFSIIPKKQHLWCVGDVDQINGNYRCDQQSSNEPRPILGKRDTYLGRSNQFHPRKMRLGKRITNKDTVESLAQDCKEMCVFVSSLLETSGIDAPSSDMEYDITCPGDDGIVHKSKSSNLVLTHHSIYIPETLRIEYLGSLVVDVSVAPNAIQKSINTPSDAKTMEDVKKASEATLEKIFGENTSNNHQLQVKENGIPETHVFSKVAHESSTGNKEAGDSGVVLVRSLLYSLPCDTDTILPNIVWLDEQDPTLGFTKATDCPLISGGRYVWQRKSTSPFLKLYPDVQSFHRFFTMERIHFTLKKVYPPYTTVAQIKLPLAMPYEYVQRYVYNVLKDHSRDMLSSCVSSSSENVKEAEGCCRRESTYSNLSGVTEGDEWDLIRFSRYNSITKGPFFKKIKKKDGADLQRLLMNYGELQPYLYFEVGKYTVTELEASNPLSFDFFNANVQILSTHTILLPPPDSFTINELLGSCATEVGLPPEKASSLQLVDIWQGKIYHVHLPSDQTLSNPFEESAEYRVEPIPEMISDLPKDEQLLVPVQHFHYIDNKVVAHGDPFGIWMGTNDTRGVVFKRIAHKLGVSEPSIAEWRPRFVQGNRVVPMESDIPFAEQLASFLCQRWTRANGRPGGKPVTKPSPYGPKSTVTFGFYHNAEDPSAMPFFGMEHAPIPKRRGGPARNNENDLTIM